jgi:hypothetical protein
MRILYIALIAYVCAFVFVSGCVNSNRIDVPEQVSDCQIKDYDNGVLYFGCVDNSFAMSLSKYISDHPNTTILSISGTNQDFYGEDHGYIVVIKNEL